MSINFNVAPYYDDYSEDDDYLRILFRPGYAVQARELTQLQTILQKQVTRFGDHVFKNGSQVIPGSVNVDNTIHFAKLENVYLTQTVNTYLSQFVDKIVTGLESGVKALVVDTSECDCVDKVESDIPTLYFKLESPGGTEGETSRFIPGETLVAYAADNTTLTNYRLSSDQTSDLFVNIRSFGDNGVAATTYTKNASSDVLGYGYVVEVEAGVYYVDGYFIKNQEMHLYIGRFTTTPSYRVGFQVTESIVTPEEQPLLADNSQGSTNYAAPGAHRYKISLSLVKLPLDSTDDIRFIELLRVVSGRVQHKIQTSSYAQLEKTLARRTFDQSGNYEVSKFKLTSREHLNSNGNGVYPPIPDNGVLVADQVYGDEDKFVIAVDPGKAYVEGFEIESTATQFISIDKARENTITGDEGGHIVRQDDYPIATPVGNYLVVNNVFSYPDLSAFPLVYLYNKSRVPAGGSALTDGTPPVSGKVGTARVKAFQLYSSAYTTGDATQFMLGLFDVQMDTDSTTGQKYNFASTVKSVAGATSGTNTFTCDVVPGFFQIVGAASSTSGNKTVTGVGSLFVDQLAVGDILYINGTAAGVIPAYAAGTAGVQSNVSLLLENNAPATLSGIATVFRAELQDPKYDSLVFKSEFRTLKTLRGLDTAGNDTVKSSTQTVRRKLTANADASNLSYTLTSPSEFFDSVQSLANYTLFDDTTKTFVAITGSHISLTSDRKTFTVSVSGAGLTASRAYTLIASIVQTGTPAGERTKTMNLDYAHLVTGKKEVSNTVITLPHADVLRIKDIRVTPGNFDTYSASNSVSIKDKYIFDDGQRQTHYQQATLTLIPNSAPPSGAITVTYDYFTHTGSGNYFSVNSYDAAIANTANNFTYSDIPTYAVKGTDGKTETVYLSDVIDYRPVIGGSNTFAPELPKIGEDFNTSLAYYLPRFDKIVLDNVGRFNVLKGIPALDPIEPKDPKEGMVMCSIYVPAFTRSTKEIRVYPRDNKRYTMKDIGNLERRIQNLEYYVSLTLLEQETASLSIKDANTGLDRFKNGFIVDQFTGHGVGDVKNIDYRIAVDPARGELRPMHYTDALDLIEDVTSSDERFAQSYKKNGDIITLPYTTSLFIFNPNGTRSIDVNPYKVAAFKGEVQLIPEGDNWKDTDRRPDLQVTDDNNSDAIKYMAEKLGVTGTVWNQWQTQWTGSTSTTSTFQTGNPNARRQTVTGYATTTTVDTGTQSRTGLRTSATETVNTQDYGDRVVDISFAEYMRARPVTFVVSNLKPSGKFYPFFDGDSVAEYVIPADVFKVTRLSGTSIMNFDAESTKDRVIAGDAERTEDGQAQIAYQIGDVLQNDAHTPCTIQTITQITDPLGAATLTLTVDQISGVRVGHHVELYNLNAGKVVQNIVSYDPVKKTQVTITNRALPTANELNNRKFKVSAVTPSVVGSTTGTGTITLTTLDGKKIPSFSAYNKSAYKGTDGGKLTRLRASCVVVQDGVIDATDTLGVAQIQDLFVANIKNGFSIGESLTGKINFAGGTRNRVTLTSVNGTTSGIPTMKQFGDPIRTDVNGSTAGVFKLPNSDAKRFRTGERDFKLTDNQSNSDANFDSKGSATYYSQGITLSKEATVVNSRTVTFTQDRLYESIPVRRVSTSTRVLYSYYTGHDPIAQTFVVSATGGAFVTHVDLYFSEAGNRPVTVELRTTNMNIPSTKIIPLSQVTKTPNKIKTSEDGSVATRFTFQAPIYLQDNEMYALVVKTDQPGCQLFVSEVGKEDILTGNIVTVQPLTGSLYLSQNSKEFEINPLLDMKFRMHKADFETNTVAQLQLRAQPPKRFALDENPFEVSTGTDIVRVHARRHGFSADDIVLLDGIEEWIDEEAGTKKYYGASNNTYGIPGELLNGPHTVLADGIDIDSFCIRIQTTDEYLDTETSTLSPNRLITNAAGTQNDLTGTTFDVTVQSIMDEFVKGNYGGTGVTCSRQLILDEVFLKSDSIVTSDSTLDWSVQAMSTDDSITGYQAISENSNFSFGSRKIIRSFENEELLAQTADIISRKPSLTYRAKFSTTNPNVSPIIDLQKISSYVIRNLVNSTTEEQTNIIGVDDRTLLKANDVVDTDIDATVATGNIYSYFLSNPFQFSAGTYTYSTSADGATYTVTPVQSTWKWDGSGSGQTTQPHQRLQIGDLLYKADTTTLNMNTASQFYGWVSAVSAGSITVTKALVGGLTGTATLAPATGVAVNFLVISKYVYGDASAAFTSKAPSGTLLYNNAGTLIGEVDSVSSATQLVLKSAAQVGNGVFTNFTTHAPQAWSVGTQEAKLTFSNVNGYGQITTNIDVADNLLSVAKAGKYIYLTGLVSGINGKYLVRSVDVATDSTVYVGNEEGDKITLQVSPAFTFAGAATTYTVDLINDYLYLTGAGTITSSTANGTVTGTSTTFTTQVAVGDVLTTRLTGGDTLAGVLGTTTYTPIGVVGAVSSATGITIANNANAGATVTGSSYAIRKPVSSFKVSQLDKFVEDWAPIGSSNYANYITRPLVISNPADSFKIMFDANVPLNTSILVYYKAWSGTVDINNLNYTDTGFSVTTIDPIDTFSERMIDVEDITPYNNLVVKIVMKSTNPANVPKIKNLRIVTHS